MAAQLKRSGQLSAARPPALATPGFWPTAKRRLQAADPTLASIMACHPRVCLVSRGNGFTTLARSIVGQQISLKAADSVWIRLVDRCPEMTPHAVLARRLSTLRACGLSQRKAEYLRDLARHFVDGHIDLADLADQTDEAVIERLTDVRGIGRWTAEMFLIFNLLRPDVLPLDDLGLLKAVSRHYFGGESTTGLLRGAGRAKVAQLGARWAPYRSVATWYLWRSLDPVPVEY
ncbi:MAG TPA: DNA-3-methyladenine glycosylase 2 family protein [Burkholderiaceae bacterium]|nr:DNA-3-methyladenine glycosylase 2 family protein [Burkholderiaceae bacterium]